MDLECAITVLIRIPSVRNATAPRIIALNVLVQRTFSAPTATHQIMKNAFAVLALISTILEEFVNIVMNQSATATAATPMDQNAFNARKISI